MTRSAIALCGFMGAGKTTVGLALSARLQWAFVDLDAEFVRKFGPISDFFSRWGEQAFREKEQELLAAVPRSQVVLSLGGGTTVDATARLVVERDFDTVFLELPFEDAAKRVGQGSERPLWSDASDRFRQRTPIYMSARTRVDATLPVAEIVDRILAAPKQRTERVALADRSYEVVITDGFQGLDAFVGSDVRIVTDDTVGPLWADALRAHVDGEVFTMPAGEKYKTLDTWRGVVDDLISSRTLRSSVVVALGGGVVGDVAGFAAATVNRGVPLVQVPTTTLAMVDSSVGGKTGVNHPRGKNLVGAFHQPSAVWMNLETLRTLAPRERRAGFAEVLKTGAVLDAALLDVLEAGAEALAAGDIRTTEHIVALSVRAKAAVVARDEREGGVRRVLNAGHTVGHALERAASYGTLLHGEAVAIGLVAEARWAAEQGHCDTSLPDRIAAIAARLGLPTQIPAGLDPETIRDAMAVDKKAARDILYLPVPVRAGSHVVLPVPVHRLTELLPEPG